MPTRQSPKPCFLPPTTVRTTIKHAPHPLAPPRKLLPKRPRAPLAVDTTHHAPDTPSYQTGKLNNNHRVFLDRPLVPGQTVPLPSHELRHLRARRARIGDHLLIFNRAGQAASALLQGADARLLHTRDAPAESPALSAVVGLPKGAARADWLVEKLTELGASAVTLAVTARTNARPADTKLARWRRLAVAAAKQSLRDDVPVVSLEPFSRVLELAASHPAPLLLCTGGVPLLGDECTRIVERARGALLLVGPEGGFEEGEIDALAERGAVKVGLGKQRLRVETAAVVAAGVVSQLLMRPTASGNALRET